MRRAAARMASHPLASCALSERESLNPLVAWMSRGLANLTTVQDNITPNRTPSVLFEKLHPGEILGLAPRRPMVAENC